MKKLTCAILLIGLSLLLTACLGPKPVVKEFTLHAPPSGTSSPYSVEVLLTNDGPGGGEVALEIELVNKKTGEVIAQETKQVELAQNETVRKQIDLDLPQSLQSIDPNDIDVHVDAHYPIE
ncbi:MAG: hypothetical protein ABIQ44_11855 [Chloroflexia bacterium]